MGAFNTNYPEIYHDISHEIRMCFLSIQRWLAWFPGGVREDGWTPGTLMADACGSTAAITVNQGENPGDCFYIHICTYIYIHTHIYKYIYMYIYICMSKLRTIHQVSKFLKKKQISERQKWTWHLLLSDPSMVCIPPWEEWTSRAAVLPSGKVRCGNISPLDVVNPNGS
jgi:hypothetical protein